MLGFNKQTRVSHIDSNGTTDVVWEDLRFPASTVKLDSVKPPTETAYKGGQVLSFPDNADKKIYFVAQLPHAYKLGTDLFPHIHYVLAADGSGVGSENVKFDLTYTWANIMGEFQAETTISGTVDVQDMVDDTHYLLDINTSDVIKFEDAAGDDEVSSMVLCSLERDTSVADNYADDVYLLEVDFHYQLDTVGSELETQKRI